MIRSLTCVCALLAGGSGLYLYSEKHRTTLLDQQISKIVADTQQIRERTSMLRAEWALLNQPDRLQQLSGRFLPQLGAMAPTQFVQMASLDQHLPPVGPETPPHPIATPETAPALVGATPGAPGITTPSAAADAIARADSPHAPQIGAGSVAPVQVATALPATQQAARVAATRTALAHARPPAVHHDVQLADSAEPDGADAASLRRVAVHAPAHATRVAPPVRVASLATPSTRPAVSAVSSLYSRPPVIAAAAWHPARATWPAARPVSYSTPVSAPVSASAIGSSLGSTRSSLPAPVPVSDGN